MLSLELVMKIKVTRIRYSSIYGINSASNHKVIYHNYSCEQIILVASPFFTERLTWFLVLQILWKHLLSTEIFPYFIPLYSRGDKKNKISKLLTKINFTGSYTRNMVIKFVLEPNIEINILQKNYQALYHYDKLVMQLT